MIMMEGVGNGNRGLRTMEIRHEKQVGPIMDDAL